MDTQQIMDALKEERERLDRAIAVLEGGSPQRSNRGRSVSLVRRKGQRRMSPEARARIAVAQRKRWAKLKAKQAAGPRGTAKK